jgi:homoserine kinase
MTKRLETRPSPSLGDPAFPLPHPFHAGDTVLSLLGDTITIRTPSTIGNFGPGFDATSLAIDWGGDHITATPSDEDRITLSGPGTEMIPLDWDRNCAALAYSFLRERHGRNEPVHLDIKKGAPPGSGLGSSASSSAAGALAYAKRHMDREWSALALVEAATFGESGVAGAHGDDVAAAIQGGLSVVRHGEVRRIMPPESMHLAIVRPHLVLETRKMRAAIGNKVAIEDAVLNLANVAFLVDACHRGDIATIARSLDDRIAAPRRRSHLPFYDAVREAALGAGASGIAISGSGPSLFALTTDHASARDLAGTMREAVQAQGVDAEAIACRPERRVVWKEELGL